MVGGTTPPQSDSGEISRVLVLNLLWQSKRCSRTAQDISVLTTPSLLSRATLRKCSAARTRSRWNTMLYRHGEDSDIFTVICKWSVNRVHSSPTSADCPSCT